MRPGAGPPRVRGGLRGAALDRDGGGLPPPLPPRGGGADRVLQPLPPPPPGRLLGAPRDGGVRLPGTAPPARRAAERREAPDLDAGGVRRSRLGRRVHRHLRLRVGGGLARPGPLVERELGNGRDSVPRGATGERPVGCPIEARGADGVPARETPRRFRRPAPIIPRLAMESTPGVER